MLPKSETSDFGCNPSFSQESFDAKKMDHQNSGVPEFWHFKGAQIGNIRFAVVKPAGDGCGAGKYWINSTGPRISRGSWNGSPMSRRGSVKSTTLAELNSWMNALGVETQWQKSG